MSLVADRERATYDAAWGLSAYAEYSPGVTYAPLLADYLPPPATVLEAGCGSGQGALALQQAGYSVLACDLTPTGLAPDAASVPYVTACLWSARQMRAVAYLGKVKGILTRANSFDAVTCFDVLEHIPPTLTLLTAHNLLSLCAVGALFSISLLPDQFGVWVGKPLHHTVQGFTEWRDQLGELGTVDDARDLGHTGIYWVTPR